VKKIDVARRCKLLAPLLVLSLGACVSSHVIVGKVRPPISPDQVQIYLHPPATKYEEIAVLDSSSRNSFTFLTLPRFHVHQTHAA
jgi:hypothetical protein